MRPTPILSAFLIAGVAMTGCAKEKDSAPSADQTSSSPVGPASDPVAVGPVEWSQDAVGIGRVDDVAVNDDVIVSGGSTAGQSVVALWDRGSKTMRWRRGSKERLPRDVHAISGRQIALGSSPDASIAVQAELAPGGPLAVAGLDPTDGDLTWTWAPPPTENSPRVHLVGVAGDVLVLTYGAVTDNGLCLGAGTEFASVGIDLVSGKESWSREGQCVDAILDGRPVTGVQRSDGEPVAAVIDAADGATAWTADEPIRGVAGDVVLWGGPGRTALSDVTDPARELPSFPAGSQPSYASPQDGLLLAVGRDGVVTFMPGDDEAFLVPGLVFDRVAQAVTVADRIVVQVRDQVELIGRDGASLAEPVPGVLIAAGEDFLELDRDGRRVVVPLLPAR